MVRAACGGGDTNSDVAAAAAVSKLTECDGDEEAEVDDEWGGDPSGEGDGIIDASSLSGLMSSISAIPADSCCAWIQGQ